MLERLFHQKEAGTDANTETIASITTFLTLSYIIFVQSAILGAAGISVGGKTGLTNVVTAGLIILALFFSPLVQMVGSGYKIMTILHFTPSLHPYL